MCVEIYMCIYIYIYIYIYICIYVHLYDDNTTLHYIILYYIILYYSILYYIVVEVRQPLCDGAPRGGRDTVVGCLGCSCFSCCAVYSNVERKHRLAMSALK